MPLSVRVTGKGIIKMNANWCFEFLGIRDFIQHKSTKNSREYIDLQIILMQLKYTWEES